MKRNKILKMIITIKRKTNFNEKTEINLLLVITITFNLVKCCGIECNTWVLVYNIISYDLFTTLFQHLKLCFSPL